MSTDDTGENVEIIRSNKGGFKLIHMGYMYTVHKRRQGGGIRWRCSQRSLHCKGSISTGPHPPQVNMTHNHSPDPHSVMLARSRQAEDQSFGDIHVNNEGLTPAAAPQRLRATVPNSTENGMNHSVFSVATPPEAEVCLRWNSHHANIKSTFPAMLRKKQYVDCTISADGDKIKCHKLVLSSCSAYFDDILSQISPGEHPVIFLKGMQFWIVKSLIDFMYQGEIHIEQSRLKEVLEAANILKVKGLTGTNEKTKPCTEVAENGSNDDLTGEDEQIDPMQMLQNSYAEPILDNTQVNEDSVKDKKILQRKVRLNSSSSTGSQRFNEKNKAISACFTARKGTKSRPVVKAPKYYHNEDYDETNGATSGLKTETSAEEASPKIKSEPIDAESDREDFESRFVKKRRSIDKLMDKAV